MRPQLLEDFNLKLEAMEPTIKVKKIVPNAKLPKRADEFAAGADLYSIYEKIVMPGERAFMDTGIQIENTDPNTYFRIAPRSGLAAKYGIDTLAGVIDSNYRGNIIVILVNTGNEPFVINEGDRIAQLIQERVFLPTFEWSEDLNQTERNDKGFGSTGT